MQHEIELGICAQPHCLYSQLSTKSQRSSDSKRKYCDADDRRLAAGFFQLLEHPMYPLGSLARLLENGISAIAEGFQDS